VARVDDAAQGVGATDGSRRGAGPADPEEVAVDLPACDGSNPSVKFVQSDADWEGINAPQHWIFCVQPGDYRPKGIITITADGTASAPRVIRYHDPTSPDDDTHPVQMSADRRAIVKRVNLVDADHWVMDRLTLHGELDASRSTGSRGLTIQRGSERNIINRWLIEKVHRNPIQITGLGTDFNVIQRSVIRDTAIEAGDRVAILLHTGRPNRA
jgi:hypothetical protein